MANQEALNKVLNRIAADPSLLDMSMYGRGTECGTVACLAGHTVMEYGYRLNLANKGATCYRPMVFTWLQLTDKDAISTHETAAKILGLTEAQAKALFFDMKVETYEELVQLVKEVTDDGWNPESAI
jgi:hypothetical protein